MFNKIANFIIKYQDIQWIWLIGVFLVVCLIMLPLPLMGIPIASDLTQHLQFASTYQEAILAGDFFPGWAGTDNEGFGSIGIRFYPPVAYYLMAFSQMIIDNWYDTFWTNAFFWMLIGAIGTYLWSREWLSPFESALVAIFYSFTPYHRIQIFQSVLFAEFAAAGILPFCFLTITRVIRRGRKIDVILFSISFALLTLTHIPTTVLSVFGLGIYALSLMDWKNYRSIFAKLIIGGGLSLLAGSFHWLRLATEMQWIKHTEEKFAVKFFNYKYHFFPISLEVKHLLGPVDAIIILLMLSLLPLAVYLLIQFKVKQQTPSEKGITRALAITGFLCLFMMTYPSLIIWENLTFFQKVQFPWRWLSVASLIASFALVFSLGKLFRIFQHSNKSLRISSSLLFGLVFIYVFMQSTFHLIPLNRENFAREIQGLKEKKGCECWQPNWSKITEFKKVEKIYADARNFNINKWESESKDFEIEAGLAQKVRISTFYYPHWKAEVNGQAVEIEKDTDGSMLIPIGTEKSVVKLNFEEPKMLQLALAGSLATWLFLLILLIFFYRKDRKINQLK